MNNEQFYKLQDVQKMLNVSRSTLWRWTAEHGLKVVRVGSLTRIRESDLQAFLTRHEWEGPDEGSEPNGDSQVPE